MTDLNPQEEQMTDESMVRNLAAQAEAIWPQEKELIPRYRLPEDARVLDVGSGTGEFSARMAGLFPQAEILGVEIHAPHVVVARERCAAVADRVRFVQGDAFALAVPDKQFDLVTCRHLFQAVPHPERILAGMIRAARPGGWIHVVAEDYAMMHFHPCRTDSDRFWLDGPITFALKTGSDLRVGRLAHELFVDAGLLEIRVDYVVIDTLRVPRETFAAIWEAWRDGYTDAIAAHTRYTREETLEVWAEMLAAIRDPRGYGVWHLPVWSARVPGEA